MPKGKGYGGSSDRGSHRNTGQSKKGTSLKGGPSHKKKKASSKKGTKKEKGIELLD